MLTRHPAISGDRPGEEPIAPPAPVSAPSGLPSPAAGAESDDVQASLRRRILSPHTLISFAVAVALLWFVMRRMDIDPRAIWAQVRQASPLLLAVAFLFWYGSFFVRAWRWGRMLDRSGVADAPTSQLPSTAGLTEIMLLGWFANSIVPAKLGDAYRGYLLKRESRVSFSGGFGTILAERFVDAMMLVVVLGGTALLVFGGRMPEEATLALTLGAILLVAGIGGIILMWFTRDTLLRLLPDRLRDVYARLQGAVFGSLRSPALVLGIGLLLWLGDGMRVWFVARSLNAGISPSVAILVALMGALLTVIPFTPAGLGVVELGVGSILIGVFGLDPVLAGSIIVLDRVVAYWSLLVVGALLYLRRARRDLRAAAVEQPAT